jgi:hypothetical protein
MKKFNELVNGNKLVKLAKMVNLLNSYQILPKYWWIYKFYKYLLKFSFKNSKNHLLIFLFLQQCCKSNFFTNLIVFGRKTIILQPLLNFNPGTGDANN